jgi:DNA-binding beta-propeller fold protein YncE
MAISSDGRCLYLLKFNYELGSSAYSLLTFDTVTVQFTPEEQFIPDCPRPQLLAIPGERRVKVLCDGGADIEVPDARFVLRLPHVQNFAVGRGGNALYVAEWDGKIQEVNIATHEIVGGHLLRSWRMMPSSGTLSSDGRLWYLPAKIPNNGEQGIEQILVFDAQARKITNVITPVTPFWGLALSSDGKWLYASQPERNSISVIDTAAGRISRMLAVAGKPSIVFAIKRP